MSNQLEKLHRDFYLYFIFNLPDISKGSHRDSFAFVYFYKVSCCKISTELYSYILEKSEIMELDKISINSCQ